MKQELWGTSGYEQATEFVYDRIEKKFIVIEQNEEV